MAYVDTAPAMTGLHGSNVDARSSRRLASVHMTVLSGQFSSRRL
jgi:hypothetical protein